PSGIGPYRGATKPVAFRRYPDARIETQCYAGSEQRRRLRFLARAVRSGTGGFEKRGSDLMAKEWTFGQYEDIGAELQGNVAVVELRQPPNNYFSNEMIRQIAHAY